MGRPGGGRRGGGGGGGMGGMGGMGGGGGFDPMKMLEGATASAKKAAEELEKELAQKTCEGAAGGGMVTAVVTGTIDVRSIRIDPAQIAKAAADPSEKEMLEDVIVAAINAAAKKAKELQAQAQAELQQKQIQQMFGGGGMGDIGKMLGM